MPLELDWGVVPVLQDKPIINLILLPVHIACVGEGPVVHMMPLELDWGVVPV